MRIEYEDRDIIVIYKEAGLPVQSGRTSQKDLVSLLKNNLAQEPGAEKAGEEKAGAEKAGAEKAREPYLGIIHRLDQPVEGLLVFAKTPKAAADLSRQAAAKGETAAKSGAAAKSGRSGSAQSGMEKIYRAVVVLSGESFPLALEGRRREVTLTDWLLRDYSNNTAVVVEEGAKGAKCAELSFRTLEIKDLRALTEIRLHTGRHHQIRVQMAHAGMPLAGDRKYGTAGPEEKQLCLCASRLAFRHPGNGKRMEFEVEPSFSV